MSQYAEYIKERLGDDIIETDQGFATYRYTDAKTVYIVDIYVRPDFRKDGIASELADIICDAARFRGCTKVIGSVVPSSKGSADSMRVLLAYGMKPVRSGEDYVIFEKGLV